MDALYQTVVTISTVGYADKAEGHGVQVFTIIMIGVGTVAIAVLISLITGSVVETQLRDIFGRRRMEKMLRTIENHVIVCGYGRLGRKVCDELSRKGDPIHRGRRGPRPRSSTRASTTCRSCKRTRPRRRLWSTPGIMRGRAGCSRRSAPTRPTSTSRCRPSRCTDRSKSLRSRWTTARATSCAPRAPTRSSRRTRWAATGWRSRSSRPPPPTS